MPEQSDSPLTPDDDRPVGPEAGEVPNDLKSLEARLAALVPRRDRLDRERLAFLAGQASVAATSRRPVSLLGLKLAAEVWPRAFAAMTTVAAALLALLLMRPSTTDVRHPVPAGSIARSSRPSEPQSGVPGLTDNVRTGVLSAGDVRRADIEQLLANDVEDFVGTMPNRTIERPVLTPTKWYWVTPDADHSAARRGESSFRPANRGVQS